MNTRYATAGYVYAIRAGDTCRVKIGITRDLKVRLRDLQRGETETLRLIASVESSTAHERELHRVLADSQLGGEWFNLGLTDEEITDLLSQPAYQVRGEADDSPAVSPFDALDLPPEAEQLQDAYWKARREWEATDKAYHLVLRDLLNSIEVAA